MTKRRTIVRAIQARVGGPRKSRVRSGPMPLVLFVLIVLAAAALAGIFSNRSYWAALRARSAHTTQQNQAEPRREGR
jgi:hypothetical protein